MGQLKARFGKYKAKDADEYIQQLCVDRDERLASLQARCAELERVNEELNAKIKEYEQKESVIAKVMLDATQRANAIEEEYKKRAEQSDEACRKLQKEWVSGMQSASANLAKIRSEAKNMVQQIDTQFASLCSWADSRLESLEKAQLPTKGETLEDEIAKGAGADLEQLCKEMGFSDNETENCEKTTENEA